MGRNLVTWLATNINGLVFMAGYVALCAGVWAYSRPLAGVIGGGILMVLSAWPYLRRKA